MSILDFGLGLAGLPDATIKELDKQLPALERLVAQFKQAQPDIAAVTPLIQQLIAFAKQKENEK